MSRHGQHHPAKGPTQRQLRVGEEVRHALAWTLERGGVRDPDLSKTPVTVTEVSVSPDLKNALCFVTPLGGGDATTVVEALQRASKFLRFEVARTVKLKHTPSLRFIHDTSFDTVSYIDGLLQQPEVARDLNTPDIVDDLDRVDEGAEDA